jgi:putative FmdB family regulatory protein
MPIYEYSCEKCGKTIEVIQKMSDKPLRKHEKCGGKLSKLISASGFQFKGTGWYVTDYGTKSTGEGKESSRDVKDAKDAKDTKDAKTSAKGAGDGGGEKPAAPAESSKKTGKPSKSSDS